MHVCMCVRSGHSGLHTLRTLHTYQSWYELSVSYILGFCRRWQAVLIGMKRELEEKGVLTALEWALTVWQADKVHTIETNYTRQCMTADIADGKCRSITDMDNWNWNCVGCPEGWGGEVGGWQMQCVYTTVIQCLYFVYARTSLAFGWPPPHLPSTTMFIQLFQQRQIDKLGRKVRHYLLATDTFPSIQLTNFTLPNTI